MEYRSPFHYIDPETDPSALDARAIQRARKKLQAEFDILNDNSLEVQARKNELIQWLDNLKPEQLAWHQQIFHNKPLLDFLEQGKITSEDWTIQTPALRSDTAFYEFVMSHVSTRYDALLAEAFRTYDVRSLKQLKLVYLPDAEKRGRYYYASTINLLTAHYHNLLQLTKVLDSSVHDGNMPAYTQIPFLLAINELPSYFQSMRNEFAQSLAQLGYSLRALRRREDESLIDAALYVATSLSVSAITAARLNELKKTYSSAEDHLQKNTPQAAESNGTKKSIGGCISLLVLLSLIARVLIALFS